MKKTISNLAATAVMALAAIVPGFAQTDLGKDCGCPVPVSTRPTVLMSSLPGFNAATGELTTGASLVCTNTYILDQKIYVPAGQVISIAPGTVIKGRFQSNAANAVTLSIEVGGKIYANGDDECQVVFTAEADNLDGTFPISSIGQWGGVTIAGKASNNLTLAANGPFQSGVGDGKLCIADGIGTFEGFSSSNSKDQFGVTPASFDDNDDSGILRYVSIRHAGAVLQVGGELNGLSLGSVGRGTTIDYLEIVSCADDGIELWGGTVNIKHYASLFGNDDMFDWDDGYRGKAQFIFGLKTDVTSSTSADNGFEMDADDQKSNLLPRSHPVIFNATMIGNSQTLLGQGSSPDESGIAAIEAKELTEGEISNSVFAGFRYGFNVIKALGSRTGTSEAYHNWSNASGNGSNSLKIKCNTFIGTLLKNIAIDKNGTGVVSAADSTQFYDPTGDNNIKLASAPGFTYAFTVNNTTNAVTVRPNPTPSPALSTAGCPVAPVDGFFVPASYRGAFSTTGKNWLSEWAYAAVLGVVSKISPCPTDVTGDSQTTNADLSQILLNFGTQCK